METLISFARTQVEGASQKITSKGKGKLKEKVIKPPSSNAFVEVPLSQTLQTIDDMRRERRAITPPVLPTHPLGGV